MGTVDTGTCRREARRGGGALVRLRDPATGRYHLDVFREPHDGDQWICRRDSGITLPYTELIRTSPAGIPYAIPEAALLAGSAAVPPLS
ncbi:hypothetical protein [Nocardia spumae]|uniref:hypothetical protein n=1 Tax=Nocardia spumae TaxID=2887190 RepID=UPI001D153005|nr:hypothetical protein [Nocardia spumae]